MQSQIKLYIKDRKAVYTILKGCVKRFLSYSLALTGFIGIVSHSSRFLLSMSYILIDLYMLQF